MDLAEFERGKVLRGCGYTKTVPRKWTDSEIEYMKKLKEAGRSNAEIAAELGRSEVSISIKLKRLTKKENTYNADHLGDKYDKNRKFLWQVKPHSILDLYCGTASWWKNELPITARQHVVTNDIDSSINADYHERAEKLIHKLYYDGCSFDLIDLDPFGSAYECFDLGIKMARLGLVITFGELGHKRFKRLDYVRDRYGINSIDEFTLDRLIETVQRIGRQNKKKLTPAYVGEWRGIARVWFTIEPYKVTEQWHKEV